MSFHIEGAVEQKLLSNTVSCNKPFDQQGLDANKPPSMQQAAASKVSRLKIHEVIRDNLNHKRSNVVLRRPAEPKPAENHKLLSNKQLMIKFETRSDVNLQTNPSKRQQIQSNTLSNLVNSIKLSLSALTQASPIEDPCPVSPDFKSRSKMANDNDLLDLIQSLKNISTTNFIETFVEDRKYTDLVFAAIDQNFQDVCDILADKLKGRVDYILGVKQLCKLLVKLVYTSLTFQRLITGMTDLELYQYFYIESSSRVLQAIVKVDEYFRARILKIVQVNWLDIVSSQPAVYLACQCIREAGTNLNLDWVFKRLISNPSKLLASKYQKKVLISFMNRCDSNQNVQIVCQVIDRVSTDKILRDRHLTEILARLTNQQNKLVQSKISTILSVPSHYRLGFFGFMISQLNFRSLSDKFVSLFLNILHTNNDADKDSLLRIASACLINIDMIPIPDRSKLVRYCRQLVDQNGLYT